MLILGIETSCDETAVALYCPERGLLGHQLHSQISLHAPFGGVVPELASRDHVRKLLPLVQTLMADAQVLGSDIGGIAYTAGPGLMGALMVGALFAKGLSMAWQVPALAVHHMEGHLLAPFLETPAPQFPFLSLLVSGGHSLLIYAKAFGQYEILGQSLDDAAGEAFDKTAKLLGLAYPGGPNLSQLALEGDSTRFQFPRPLSSRPGYDFSFSGLKTHTAQAFKKTAGTRQDKADIACAFQDAVVDSLFIKCQRALAATQLKQLVVAGGVSANTRLREKFATFADNVEVFYPRHEFCTDNAAMIALTGHYHFQAQSYVPHSGIYVRPRWPLDSQLAFKI